MSKALTMKEHAIEAIAHLEQQPRTMQNVRARTLLRNVAQYLNDMHQSEVLAQGSHNHD